MLSVSGFDKFVLEATDSFINSLRLTEHVLTRLDKIGLWLDAESALFWESWYVKRYISDC